MVRRARGEDIDPAKVQVLHCTHRCVRRAFLCGYDEVSKQSFEHRRVWIRQRLEFLASIFAIECITYAVLSNHLHLVLRTRPDIVAKWSDREVATRWLRLFPGRRRKDGSPEPPTEVEIKSITGDPKIVADRRRRLSDVSWWMRCTAENIARRSNREDEVTGHFWESRFKAQELLDEASLVACAAYVDLNPVRAAIAETPEESDFTGAKDRIDDLKQREDPAAMSDHQWERSGPQRFSGWLSPVEIDERSSAFEHPTGESHRRADEKGFASLSLSRYLELLDWTGRQLRAAKRGRIPDHLSSILKRLGLQPSSWCDLVADFGRRFRRVVGRPDMVQAAAGG